MAPRQSNEDSLAARPTAKPRLDQFRGPRKGDAKPGGSPRFFHLLGKGKALVIQGF